MSFMLKNVYEKLTSLFTKYDQKKFKKLIIYSVIMAFLEAFSLALVVPVTSFLLDEKKLKTFLGKYLSNLDVDILNYINIVGIIGVCSGAFFLLSSSYRAFVVYKLNYFAQLFSASLSQRLLQIYLNQNYDYFLSNNTSKLVKNTLSEVDVLIGSTLLPLVNIISQLSICIALIVVMTFLSPTVVLTAGAILLIFYIILFFGLRHKILISGEDRVRANEARFNVATQILNGIKVVKCTNKEEAFLSTFTQPTLEYAVSTATVQTLSQTPRYIVEGLLLCGFMLVLTGFSVSSSDNFSSAIIESTPLILFFIFGLMKLLPIFQAIFHNLAVIKGGIPTLDLLFREIKYLSVSKSTPMNKRSVLLKDKIIVQDLSIKYKDQTKPALRNINLEITKGETVGLIGPTGSGKTTLADALVGILMPTSGEILIDGVTLDDNCRQAWSKTVGYVPQDVYLLDDNVAANIAFGVEEDKINMNRVIECAKKAKIHDHIVENLERGYLSHVGERGVKLSGGQRQRLGIARALYSNASLIIFDEATSALDAETENSVMQAIFQLKGEYTVIIIAHRLGTLKECDKIVAFKNGNIESIGTYWNVINNIKRGELT